MWKWIVAAVSVTILIVLVVLMTRERGLTLPGVEGPFGILPDIPGETRSMAELNEAARSADPEVRREALIFLQRLVRHDKVDAAEAEPLFLAGVKDADRDVRSVATHGLSFPPFDPETSGPILVSLVDDPDWKVRANAVSGLAALLERHAAVEGTVRKITFSTDRRMSPAGLDAAESALVRAWNDSSPDVRRYVSKALLYRPEVRYSVPKEWLKLPEDQARERVVAMGLLANGETLLESVKKDDVAGVFMLLKAGVDPNSRGEAPSRPSPLVFIYPRSRPEITRFLLDAGVDVRQKNSSGRVPWEHIESMWGGDPAWEPFGRESLEMLRAAGAAP